MTCCCRGGGERTATDLDPDLEAEAQRPVRLQVVAGPCNHRNRVGQAETGGAAYASEVSRCVLHNIKLTGEVARTEIRRSESPQGTPALLE